MSVTGRSSATIVVDGLHPRAGRMLESAAFCTPGVAWSRRAARPRARAAPLAFRTASRESTAPSSSAGVARSRPAERSAARRSRGSVPRPRDRQARRRSQRRREPAGLAAGRCETNTAVALFEEASQVPPRRRKSGEETHEQAHADSSQRSHENEPRVVPQVTSLRCIARHRRASSPAGLRSRSRRRREPLRN